MKKHSEGYDFLLIFHCEIITFMGNCKNGIRDLRYFQPVSPDLTLMYIKSYVIIIQHQNQEIDTGTIFMYSSMLFHSCIDSCNHHQTRIQDNVFTRKTSICYPFTFTYQGNTGFKKLI